MLLTDVFNRWSSSFEYSSYQMHKAVTIKLSCPCMRWSWLQSDTCSSTLYDLSSFSTVLLQVVFVLSCALLPSGGLRQLNQTVFEFLILKLKLWYYQLVFVCRIVCNVNVVHDYVIIIKSLKVFSFQEIKFFQTWFTNVKMSLVLI